MRFVPKIKIKAAIADELENQVVDCIQQTVQTGQIGDGKIFVCDLNTAILMRTGETGHMAL